LLQSPDVINEACQFVKDRDPQHIADSQQQEPAKHKADKKLDEIDQPAEDATDDGGVELTEQVEKLMAELPAAQEELRRWQQTMWPRAWSCVPCA